MTFCTPPHSPPDFESPIYSPVVKKGKQSSQTGKILILVSYRLNELFLLNDTFDGTYFSHFLEPDISNQPQFEVNSQNMNKLPTDNESINRFAVIETDKNVNQTKNLNTESGT